MNEAKISEIFMSYQGEGQYTGVKQLFIRFWGCSYNCIYCDTRPEFYETFTIGTLLNKLLGYKETYHSISLTGGEPLEQADFIEGFLKSWKKTARYLLQREIPIYLETSGILHKELLKIIGLVDIISMDIKLPSSTGKMAVWQEHREFLKIARTKDILIKIIITRNSKIEDILTAKNIISEIDRKIPVIIQPVDPVVGVIEPHYEAMLSFRRELKKDIEDVRIMPQWHKVAGIK